MCWPGPGPRCARRWVAAAGPYPTWWVASGPSTCLPPRLGLSVGVDNHYFLYDELDGVVTGRYNDYYWGGRAGVVLYLGRRRAARVTQLAP